MSKNLLPETFYEIELKSLLTKKQYDQISKELSKNPDMKKINEDKIHTTRYRRVGSGPEDVRLRHSNKIIELEIAGDHKAIANADMPKAEMTVTMVKGQAYPVHIIFYNEGKKDGIDYGGFSIKWSWGDGEPSTIPATRRL